MPVARPILHFERHDAGSGTWVVVDVADDGARIRSGTTGNRVDPRRRVPRSCWEIRRIGGALELLATWPVSELVTHRIGEHVTQLADDVGGAGGDPAADLATIAEALTPVLVDDEPGLPLDARLWAAAYPLLREPLAQGATLDRLPVALDRLLRAPDPRRAAQGAFGRVTRPLVRALASSLLPAAPGRPTPFEPVLLALMASPWCGPEQLTAILSTPPQRPGAVAFDVGDIDRSRALFEGVPVRRVAATLQGALADPDGTRLLAERIATWRPPAPPPGAATATTPARPVLAAPVPPGGLRPPPRTDVALRHPPTLQAVDGLQLGRRTIVLPRTADELVEWGAVLDNCLGGFRHAVADGRTHVLGVAVDGRLRWALEVTRSGVVRQFEGAGNRQAPERVAGPVLAALRERGVVRADGRRGHSLMAPR